MSSTLTEADCTCRLEEGCDEEGDPGCAYCRSIDQEWPCPAEVVPCPDHDDVEGPHHNTECCYYAEALDGCEPCAIAGRDSHHKECPF